MSEAAPWENDPVIGKSAAPWENDPEIGKQTRTGVEDVVRGAGLGARATVKGLLGIPLLAMDAGVSLGNLVNRGTNALGLTDAAQMPSASELTDQFLTKLGLASPETPGERVASDVQSAATGAGAAATGAKFIAEKAAPSVEKAVLDLLSKAPGLQVASGGLASLFGSSTRENGGGEGAQLAASLAGSILPSAIQAGGAAAMRGLVRGGEAGRQNYNRRLQTFEDAGTTPSAGQASGNRAIQSAESGLSQVSASAGVMDRAAEREAREMGAKVESIANSLVPKANATKAGLTIEKGLDAFVKRFKGEQNFLYDKLDDYIKPDARVDVSNTRTALSDLNADIPGAPNLSEWFKNSKIKGIEGALKADTEGAASVMSRMPAWQQMMFEQVPKAQRDVMILELSDGKLPYEAVKKLRTLVGNEITNNSLASDVPRSKWKALYAALSSDLEAAANDAGQQASRAFNRANAFTKAGHARIEGILDNVSGKDTAEKVFQAATNPSEMRQGATTVGTVMKSLEPEERKVVTAAVIRRMGLANPGQQNDLGERFSSQTFLTNWNKISPEAKMHLFTDPAVRKSMDQVASASDMIRTGSKVFANPSGTAPAISNQMTGWTLAGSALTGRLDVLGGIVTGLVGANISARLLTKPEFVKWLGKTTTMPGALIPAQINMLEQYAQKHWTKDEQAELANYLSEVSQQQEKPARQP